MKSQTEQISEHELASFLIMQRYYESCLVDLRKRLSKGAIVDPKSRLKVDISSKPSVTIIDSFGVIDYLNPAPSKVGEASL